MSGLSIPNASDVCTTARGSLDSSWIAKVAFIGIPLMACGTVEPVTASTYDEPYAYPFELTASGPFQQLFQKPAETTAEAVLEIRRRSGFTWEQVGDLFKVSRRSIHHWANGKAVSAQHEKIIRQVLATIRVLDHGNVSDTRAFLLAIDAEGGAIIDLLKEGHFGKAQAYVDGRLISPRKRLPLSEAAQKARRPLSQELLLEAEQKQPDIKARSPRIARTIRTPKTTG